MVSKSALKSQNKAAIVDPKLHPISVVLESLFFDLRRSVVLFQKGRAVCTKSRVSPRNIIAGKTSSVLDPNPYAEGEVSGEHTIALCIHISTAMGPPRVQYESSTCDFALRL
jgi:hypothetical protein